MKTAEEYLDSALGYNMYISTLKHKFWHEIMTDYAKYYHKEKTKMINNELLEALKEIAKGKGRFDMDQLVHASNTIEDMKSIAKKAIKKEISHE